MNRTATEHKAPRRYSHRHPLPDDMQWLLRRRCELRPTAELERITGLSLATLTKAMSGQPVTRRTARVVAEYLAPWMPMKHPSEVS